MKRILYSLFVSGVALFPFFQVAGQATVTITSTTVADGVIAQGSSANIVYVAQMQVATQQVTVNNISIPLLGTHDADDLGYVTVYFNASSPVVSGAAYLGQLPVTFAAPHTYSIGINRTIAAGESGYFIIVVSVLNTATDNHTVTVNGATNPLVFSYSTAVTLINNQTDAAGDQTIQAADVTVTSLPVADGVIAQGSSANIVYVAQMQVATQPVTVNNISIPLLGTHDADDLGYVSVYFNASSPVVAGAAYLGQLPVTFAAPHTYSIGIYRTIAAGESGYFIIVVSVLNTATDNHTVTINGATDPLVFGFTNTSNVTNNQTDAAGDQTIQAADVTVTSLPVADGVIAQGSSANIVYVAQMQVATQPVTVNNISIPLLGTHDADDLGYVSVYFNASSPVVAGAAYLGQLPVTFAAPHTYSIGIYRTIAAGESGYFIVAVGVKPTGTLGNTVEIDGAVNPLIFGFTNTTNETNNQSDASGTKTIGTVTPVSLAKFSSTVVGKTIQLSWQTETESNNTGFEIQRSSDGIQFSAIGFVASLSLNGNSTSTLLYSYTDESHLAGNNFYRLRQIDKDGKYVYSTVSRSVFESYSSIRLFPNPVGNQIKLRINSAAIERLHIRISDQAGKLVKSAEVPLVAGVNEIDMDAAGLPKGIYLIQFNSKSQFINHVLKMMKE